MKRKRFPAEQIVSIFRQAELGMAVSDIVRQLGISEQTFYRWKKQYAGMQVEGVRELKILPEENTRLKKLVAELSLDKAILQDVASKSGTARAETGSGEVHREPLRPEAGAGLSTDETGTQHTVPAQQEGSEAAIAAASERIGTGASMVGLPAPARSSEARGIPTRRQPDLPLVSP